MRSSGSPARCCIAYYGGASLTSMAGGTSVTCPTCTLSNTPTQVLRCTTGGGPAVNVDELWWWCEKNETWATGPVAPYPTVQISPLSPVDKTDHPDVLRQPPVAASQAHSASHTHFTRLQNTTSRAKHRWVASNLRGENPPPIPLEKTQVKTTRYIGCRSPQHDPFCSH